MSEYEISVPTDDENQMHVGVGTDEFECAYVWIDVRMDHMQTGFRLPLDVAEGFLDILTTAVGDAQAAQSLIDTEI